jgi:hypothetical protein
VMTWVQKETTVAAREREAVMVVLAALLEGVERVEPETLVLEVGAVVGRSAATLVMEMRPLQAAEVRLAACGAPAPSGREVETGKRVMHTERAVLEEMEETAEDTLPTQEWAVVAVVYVPATR